MPVPAGTRIGRYDVVELIGSGGMGEVYRAHDQTLQRDVALKILPVHLGGSPAASRRFENEARSIAALAHPNIISIYEFGTDGPHSYIAMELLEGETLRSIISRKSLSWKRAVKIGAAVAEALRSSHARGIAHRDLKPENIFITREGAIKVLDFGLARMMTAEGVTNDGRTITKAGTVAGTVDYMSPEQVRGEEIGPASDLFTLGCILFEMLAGTRPFTRASSAETMAAILRDDPPDLQSIRPELPEPLVRLVEHSLEKDAPRRFQSAGDLALALDAVGESSPASERSMTGLARRPRRASWTVPVLLLAAIVAIVMLGRRQGDVPQVAPAARPIGSLAVLPFVNTASDPALDYLSDGLTEAIIIDLSPVMKVSARNSVFAYKGKEADPIEVGENLDVDAVVTGRVVQRPDGLQVGVELVDARDGHQIWGERFERPLSDLTGLEKDLSRRISQNLQIRLTGADESRIQRRTKVDPDAYRLYLQGRYEWNKRTPEGLNKGIEFFRRSIDIDPTYAPAHAGIADSYLLLGGNYELLPPRVAMPLARKAALTALSLDESLAEPHASLGVIEHEFNWDWPKAEAAFKRAIELNGNYVVARQWYGHALIYRSRFDEGLAQLRQAEELDPLSLVTKADLAQAFWIGRQYDQAIARAQQLIEIEPRFWLGHWFMGLAYAGKNDLPAAAESLQRAVDLGGTPAALGTLGYVYARMGRTIEARELIQQLRSMARKRYVSPAAFIAIYGGLGDLDRAFAEMERGFQERASLLTVLDVVPIADPIRSDPRYASFARRVGLPPVP